MTLPLAELLITTDVKKVPEVYAVFTEAAQLSNQHDQKKKNYPKNFMSIKCKHEMRKSSSPSHFANKQFMSKQSFFCIESL